MMIGDPLEIRKRELIEVIPATRDFISVDGERCDGCGDCVAICPMDLWRLREKKASLSAEYLERCMECGSCAIACTKGAVDFRYPPAGTGIAYRYA